MNSLYRPCWWMFVQLFVGRSSLARHGSADFTLNNKQTKIHTICVSLVCEFWITYLFILKNYLSYSEKNNGENCKKFIYVKKSAHISNILWVHKATQWLVIWLQEIQSHVLGCSSFLWSTWHFKCVTLSFTEEPYFSCFCCFPVSLLSARVSTRASGSSLKSRKAAVVLWLTSSGSLRDWITSTVQTSESGSRWVKSSYLKYMSIYTRMLRAWQIILHL